MTQEEALLMQQQAELQRQKNQVMANAFVQPQQRFADINTQAPNLRSGLLADDAYATAVSQNVGNIDINPYLTKLNLDFQELDNEYNAYQSLYRNVNRKDVDEPRISKVLEQYKLADNVTNNRFAINEVRSKASKFREDYNSNRSEIGAARIAYENSIAAYEDLQKAVREEKIDRDTADALFAMYEDNYKKQGGIAGKVDENGQPIFNDKQAIYDTYKYKGYAPYVNEDEIINESLKSINFQGNSYAIADTRVIPDANGNGFIKATSSSGKEEYIPYAEVEDMLKTSLSNNPKYMQWIKQKAMLEAPKLETEDIANMKIADLAQDARLIATRAGLVLDENGLPKGATNGTESLSKNEAAQRYMQSLQQINTIKTLAENGQLEELSNDQKQNLLAKLTLTQTIRKGTNKTAFSRTEQKRDADMKFVDFASAAGAAMDLKERLNKKEENFSFANPNLAGNETIVPDFTKEQGTWEKIKEGASNWWDNTFTPDNNLMDNIQKDLGTKGVKVERGVSETGIKLADGRVYGFRDEKTGNYIKDANDPRIKEYINEYNKEARKTGGEKVTLATYQEAMKNAKTPFARAKAYTLSPEFKETFGDANDEFITNLESRTDLTDTQKAEQVTTYYNGLKSKMNNVSVTGVMITGDNRDKLNNDYLGTGSNLNGSFVNDQFHISNDPSASAFTMKQVAEKAGFDISTEEGRKEFRSAVSVVATTDGTGLSKSGYIITVVPKKPTWGDAPEPFVIQSGYDNNQRNAVQANLHQATEPLRNTKMNESGLIYDTDEKGNKFAYYTKRVPTYAVTVMENRRNNQTGQLESVPITIQVQGGEMPVKGGKMQGKTIADVQMSSVNLLPVKVANIGDKTIEEINATMKDSKAKQKLEEAALKEGLYNLKDGKLQKITENRNEAAMMREATNLQDNYLNFASKSVDGNGNFLLPKGTGNTTFDILSK